MDAKNLVCSVRTKYVESNKDTQFQKAYAEIELKKSEEYDPDEELTNYVMNKLLERARGEGGNMFMGDDEMLHEYIFEFYTDYEALDKKLFEDNWSKWIRGVSSDTSKAKYKHGYVQNEETEEGPHPDAVDIEAIKKQAIADYKLEQKRKEVEAMQKKAEEQKAKEEAKKKAQEESKKSQPQQISLFDL